VSPDPALPPPFDRLPEVLAGDPDAPDEVFTDDVVVVDRTSGERHDGLDEVREVWAEFAGRRAVATVDEVLGDDERAAVRFTVQFRADAHQYAQVGTAWADLDGDRIASWDVVWAEREADLSAWDGD
jgi:hypothetical protein